ncbi:hypothetical protein TSUD_04530 [Trifolium subterraneum]|nr:hypothetical protein TSUD_04530 [Trifolium subterraneum]
MHPDKSPGPDEFNPVFYQRSIIDNALIATEVIHALKRKTQGRRGELALKIDISKTYDKVDWGFLMTKMGFTDVWIRWVMMCVSSVIYSVLMNFDRVGPISPGQGLRQGDPLSPYLFWANVAEVNELMRILHTYETASGQEVNLDKSEVFISRNMSQASKEDLSHILGVKLVLGTGKEIMIKSVLQAIPSYVATNIMLWAIGMVFGKLKLRTRHVIYFGAYEEDVSRLVLDCWKGGWNVLSIVLNESSDTVGRVTMLLWCICHNRNDKLWNDIVQTPRQIGKHAFDAWNDWYSVHKLQSNNVSGTTEADLVRWEKPALDWVKCNVDVAFVSGSGRTSVGLCFRDNSDQFLVGMTQWQQTVISSVEGEAWTLPVAEPGIILSLGAILTVNV